MKNLLFLFFATSLMYGQDSAVQSKRLSDAEIDAVYTSEVKSKHNIAFGVYRAYAYSDKKGKHSILMTHKCTKKRKGKLQHDSIKAYFFDHKENEIELKRTVTDFIKTNKNSEEYSIAHWTKFFELDDFDGDGSIDPILIYGTYGMNRTGDGRLKIFVFHNGKKIGIRHQNGVLDYERNTKVDASFYKLPKAIQKQAKKQMEALTENESGIFPSGWQEAMKNKKLKFDEL